MLAAYKGWLPQGTSNATLIATMVIPIPVGLFVAWAVYRLLDRVFE